MIVIFLFLVATAAGSASTLYWIPEDDLGRGYFQMNALVVLGLLGIAVAIVALHPESPYGASHNAGRNALWLSLVGAFLYYAAIWRERWRLGRVAVTLIMIGSLGALGYAGLAIAQAPIPIPAHKALLAISLVTSMLLLGWSLITMLLGHWYLVAPKLTFKHLTVFCWALVAIVIARAFAVAGTLLSAASVDRFASPHPLDLITSFAGQGMFFWVRILWGILIPLVLAFMSLHCAQRKSNQSATGILYVLVVGAFIGEITAYYITATTGVPI